MPFVALDRLTPRQSIRLSLLILLQRSTGYGGLRCYEVTLPRLPVGLGVVPAAPACLLSPLSL